MNDVIAIIIIVLISFLLLWITVRTKMRRVDVVKGELKTPLASVGFEATDSQQSTNGVIISKLEGRNVITGNITAYGEHSTINVHDLKASKDISLGDMTSGNKQSPKET